jgi:hypothetical protein
MHGYVEKVAPIATETILKWEVDRWSCESATFLHGDLQVELM